jgi:hypothetical protein
MKTADAYAGLAQVMLYLGGAACVLGPIAQAREGTGGVVALVGVGALLSGAILLGALLIAVSLQGRGKP